jgi:DNA topoisomerase-1
MKTCNVETERLAAALRDALEPTDAASLRYVTDARPGIRRRRAGSGFSYIDAQGNPVRDPETLARIRSLVIPPAWTDVWICPLAQGHLQATGRDARGRKQYKYHPRWIAVRDETKYGRMARFGRALSRIRRRVERDRRRRGMGRAKVLASLVHLLETTLIRIGNQEYARTNGSYGLTTLKNQHVKVNGHSVQFRFRGKSGLVHVLELADRRVANVVRRCQDLPGQDLFGYVDETGVVQDVTSADVNDYLREISGEDFTTKDFRTWAGTLLAAQSLAALDAPRSQAHARRQVAQAVKTVAQRLGNTASVCRKCYIHPVVIEAYEQGRLAALMQSSQGGGAGSAKLRGDEPALLQLLESADDIRHVAEKRARKASAHHAPK